jgi:hypothetical protein
MVLVEKTDRLYRNLKDYVTMDELGLEIHMSARPSRVPRELPGGWRLRYRHRYRNRAL